MSDIQILDCTLRDGGYVNNWMFGADGIRSISDGLAVAGVDFIELGFLTDKAEQNPDSTLYSNVTVPLLKSEGESQHALMVNLGDFDFSRLGGGVAPIEYRVAFKPRDIESVSDYVRSIGEGAKFSLNPMHISLYDDKLLERLIALTNDLNPTCLTAVDTMGIMTEAEVETIFKRLDKGVRKNIALGFHSHDNLGLSLANTEVLIGLGLDRSVIIDSCLGGLGRGGGILHTEDIARVLNDRCGKCYDVLTLEQLSSEFVEPIKRDSEVEDRYCYYLTAKCKCHPNYGKYLYRKGYSFDVIERVLGEIPEADRPYYRESVVEGLVH